MSPAPMHYCGHPNRIRRGEPTLCGLSLQPDSPDVAAASRQHTTQGADVSCTDCLDVLEGRAP